MSPGPLHSTLVATIAELRAEAAVVRRAGAEPNAAAIEYAAARMEAALRAESDAALTLEQAAAESGYSADHLRHLVSAGALPNVGAKGRPRIPRASLPRKAPAPAAGGYDVDADARSLVNRRRTG